MIKGTLLEPLAWFVFAAIAVTGVCAAAYTIVQQVYREGLNDPQIQMVEDAAMRLSSAAAPADVVPQGSPVDIANSLSPWIAVYDAQGSELASSGQLNGAPPSLPAGVFDTAQWLTHPSGLYFNQSPVAQNRFTWQPNPTVRQAVIVAQTPDKKYFVAAGRNMREVEQRIEHEGEIVFAVWLFTLGCLFVASFILWRLLRPQK